MIARGLYWLPAFVAVAICGCSYRYHFDISGVVRSADGEPLAGVTIELDPIGDGSGWESEFKSGADGSFLHEMRIGPYEFDDDRLPIRVLWFSKDGYVKEKIDISPKQKPKTYKEHVPINVEARLKKVEQGLDAHRGGEEQRKRR